jgi:hypothetical protein
VLLLGGARFEEHSTWVSLVITAPQFFRLLVFRLLFPGTIRAIENRNFVIPFR